MEAPGSSGNSNYASTHTRIVKVKKASFLLSLFSVSGSKLGAAEILPPVHREEGSLCAGIKRKENIELDFECKDPRS